MRAGGLPGLEVQNNSHIRGVYKSRRFFQPSRMQLWMVLPYFVLWATLMNALFVKAKWLPPNCARCGRRPKEGDHCYCEYGRH